ncbi:MAG: hypothetical protein O3A92_17300 [Verrucomicrobia bacterium]|nr:hypothetical protein [Verrucomicrobiota bacterium]
MFSPLLLLAAPSRAKPRRSCSYDPESPPLGKPTPHPPHDQPQVYYYGYRYYDPVTGRWVSRDPIGERGG